MKYVFPAIFYQDGDGFAIRFPDEKSILTCAKTLVEAVEMAQDALNFTLLDMEESGEAIPVPSKIENLTLKPGQVVRLIEADTEKYARELAEFQAREAATSIRNFDCDCVSRQRRQITNKVPTFYQQSTNRADEMSAFFVAKKFTDGIDKIAVAW